MPLPVERGHRVICIANPDNDPECDMIGYYGHVVDHHTSVFTGREIVSVSLQGRAGAPAAAHNLDLTGDDPYLFYDHELQHAD